jgi:hypothetical protein
MQRLTLPWRILLRKTETYDRLPRSPPTLDNRLKTPVCKAAPKGGGDQMFKDLTPDYLKMMPEQKSP